MRIHKYLMFHKDVRINLYRLCGLILALLLGISDTLFADISTLERIAEAEREVSYVGIRLKTFISSRGTRTFEEYVIHKPGDTSYRKLVSEVGGRQSLGATQDRTERRRGRNENNRDDHRREQERHRWRQVKSPFPEKEIQLIAKNYNLEHSPSDEKIADYDIDLLIISPKFANRPTKHIFFARDNGVILRVEDLDSEGVLREMSVYTRISFDLKIVERKWKKFQQEIQPETQHNPSITLAYGEKILKAKPIQSEYLPPGFQLQDIHHIKGKKHTIHLIYSDGLLGFSIFETTDKRVRHANARRRGSNIIDMSGTNVYKHQRGPTAAYNWAVGDINFFLFGAMPAAEMEQVVQSIIQKANKK
ncbi:MAG: hypothetical protein OXI24_17080 [Candidatus Poribacteria bacterium]|nr:hypothetical protein [Candidatus Poribacteria bacterium]